jgi:SpoVK/Ycf46/Vps4 family AAA+-type ATPase
MLNKSDTTVITQSGLALLIKGTKIQEQQRQILLESIKEWRINRGFFDEWLWIGTNYDEESAEYLQVKLTSDLMHAPIEIVQDHLTGNKSTRDYSLNRYLLTSILRNKELFSINNVLTIFTQNVHSELHQFITGLNINGPEYIFLVAKLYEKNKVPHAQKLYERAALLGSKEAIQKLVNNWNKLGDDYFFGINGKIQDYTQAKSCYEEAANLDPSDIDAVENLKIFLEHRQEPVTIKPSVYYEKVMMLSNVKLQQVILEEIISSEELARLKFSGARTWLHVLTDLKYSPLLRTQSLQDAIEKIVAQDNSPYARNSQGKTPFFKLEVRDPYNISKRLKPFEFLGIEEKEREVGLFLERIKAKPQLEQHLLLIAGPPGVGKTEITKAVLKKQGFKIFEYIVGSEEDALRGQKEKRITDFFNQATELDEPACIFIDEIDATLPDSEGSDKNFMLRSEEIVNLFQKEIDKLKGKQVVLVGTTNYLERIKPAIKSRAGTAVIFDLPDRANRQLIIADLLRSVTLEPNSTIIQKITDATSGWSPRQLKTYIDKVKNTQPLQSTTTFTDKLFETCFEAVRKELERPRKGHPKIIAPRLTQLEATPRAMPLSEELLDSIDQICSYIEHSGTFIKINPGYKVHTLLFGLPGGGKTEFARLIVEKINCPCFIVNPGNSLKELAEVFSQAKSSEKAIIFIDEFDRFASSPDAALLIQTEMDGFDKPKNPLVIIAATNHLERIALPVLSRFGNKIEVPLPTTKQRSEFFKSVLTDIQKKTPDVFDTSLEDEINIGCIHLGEETEHFSIRDMYSALNQLTPILVKRLSAPDSSGKEPLMMTLSKIITKVKASVEIENNLPLAKNTSRFFTHPSKPKTPDVPSSSVALNKR